MWFINKNGPTKAGQHTGQLTKDNQINSDFILTAIEDGVVMVGSDNVIHLFNPAAAAITGWPEGEALGTDFHSVLSVIDGKGKQLPPDQHPFAQTLISGKPVRDDNILLATRGGKPKVISLIVSPVTQSSGALSGNAVGVFRDITQEKEEEQRRSEFISTASHEMRTPLAAIEGYLSLALNPKITQIDVNARKYLVKASASTKHLGLLFADLLTSSRAEDGRLVSYPQVVEVGETVAQTVEAERFHAKDKNLTLDYEVSASKDVAGGKVVRPLYYAFVDPNRVTEVLQNIIDNALKYTMSGSVTVKLTGDDSIIQMQVKDTGTGIPAEDIPHLFQKFYRVDSSTTRTISGTGLGLFISRKIIELYNGRIWVESELGKGSTFFINLPRLTTQQALDMQKRQSAIVNPLDAGQS